jgi:hypothetical protein
MVMLKLRKNVEKFIAKRSTKKELLSPHAFQPMKLSDTILLSPLKIAPLKMETLLKSISESILMDALLLLLTPLLSKKTPKKLYLDQELMLFLLLTTPFKLL